MRQLAPACFLALITAMGGCHLSAEVDQGGEYAIFPGAGTAATDVRPLRELLVVEQEATEGVVLYTLFRGGLADAGIGLEDLRTIATRQGAAQMAFELPLTRYVKHARELVGAGDASDGEGTGEGEVRPVEGPERVVLAVDGAQVELVQVDADGLRDVGATRWLRTLDSADFDVKAYVGTSVGEAASSGTLRTLTLDGTVRMLGARLRASLDGSAGVELDSGEEVLTVEYGKLEADYVRIELFQRIERIGDEDGDAGVDDQDDAGAEPLADGGVPELPEPDIREAMVRTILPPDLPDGDPGYRASYSLLTDVFGQGCWSFERPTVLRLVQIARDYHPGARGDLAIIHRRADRVELADSSWQPAIGEAMAESYCDSYR